MSTPPNNIAHYQIQGEIDRGSMGVVYLGTDTRLGRPVAIKSLPLEYSVDERRRRRLEREAQLLALVSHPGIAAIYSVEQSGGRSYLILEYVPGESLAARLARGPLPLREALRICAAIARALEAAHERGVMHRDLKPANVRVTPEGVVKVLDFGLAKSVGDSEDTPIEIDAAGALAMPDLTDVGALIGTIGYMSPEQLRPGQIDRRADVWAFGCVLYECLVGEKVWGTGSASERVLAITTRDPDWSRLPTGTPDRVRELLALCLRKDSWQRPGRIGETARELEEQLADLSGSGSAPAPGLAGQTMRRPERRTNIPTPITSFIGRERETEEIFRLVRTTRLLTLIGAGGCGKTRLVLEVVPDLAGTFRDGTWFVDLAPVASPALVALAVAAAVGINEEPGSAPSETLKRQFSRREMLLVLDNCEHLRDTVADLTTQLLSACPDLRVLATSREPLAIPGETLFDVLPLTTPDPQRLPTLVRLIGYESVRLFTERASRVSPLFELTPQTAEAVAQICRRLDGIPLAIELAAARVRSLTVEQIASRLDDRFELLTGGSRTAPLRHQTLRALIDWSYEQLEPRERATLRRLAVFAGSFSLEAAESIAPGGEVTEGEVLDLLAQLLDRSLVRIERRGGALRYRLLETVRAYGMQELAAAGEVVEYARRHQRFFLALAEEAEWQMRGPDQAAWFERVETEVDDIRAAMAWSATPAGIGEEGLRLAGALLYFWQSRGPIRSGRSAIELVIDANSTAPASAARSKALNAAGRLTAFLGDYLKAQQLHERALAEAQAVDSKEATARSLASFGNVAQATGRYPEAVGHLRAALEIYRELDDRHGLASVSNDLAGCLWRMGELEAARTLTVESLALHRSLRDHSRVASVLGNLANLRLALGELVPGRAEAEEAYRFQRELGSRRGVAIGESLLALYDYYQRDLVSAVPRCESAIQRMQEIGYSRGFAFAHDLRGAIELARGDVASARRWIGLALRLLLDLGNTFDLAESIDTYARAEASDGKHERAAVLYAAAHRCRQPFEAFVKLSDRIEDEQMRVAIRVEMGEPAWGAAWQRGSEMLPAEAVRFALETEPTA